MTSKEQYLIYKQTVNLVQTLMKEQGMSLSQALEEVFLSDTFQELCNVDTKMYNEGTIYIYNELLTEINSGTPENDY